MPWVRYDDRFPNHRKVVDVKAQDRTALTLHVLCGTWSASSDAPGRVTEAATIEQAGSKARAKRWAAILVDADLWHAPGHKCKRCPQITKGYVIHDWPDWNPYEEIAEKRRAAGKKGAAARWGNGTSDGKGTGNRMANAKPVDNPGIGNAEITLDQTESSSRNDGRPDSGEPDPPDSPATSDDASRGDGKSHGGATGTSSGKKWPDPDPDPEGYGSVGKSSSGRTTATADDDDPDSKIDKRIIELLAELTGRTVTADHAAKTRRQILGGRDISDPAAYVAACIRGKPRDFLPAAGDPPSTPVRQALRDVMPDADAGPPAEDPPDTFRAERERMRHGRRPA